MAQVGPAVLPFSRSEFKVSEGGHVDSLVPNIPRRLVFLEFLAQHVLADIHFRVDHQVVKRTHHALLRCESTRIETLYDWDLDRCRCQVCIVLADAG